MDYPLWFVDLENYEPGDEIFHMTKTLLDLKEDMKSRANVNKVRVFAHILKKNSHQMLFNN